MARSKKKNELKLIRVFDAPVKWVWDAWVEDKHASKWWGPRGFTITTKSKDVRVGGKWIYTMHGPNGVDYPNITTYHEVEKYSRLVYGHGGNEEREALFHVTVVFKELNDKTEVDMTIALDTPEAAQEIKKFIKKANGDSTWDRFGEYLEKELRKKDIFIINRSFSANKKAAFEMWTNPVYFSKWMGPNSMIQYKTLQPNDLLVYIHQAGVLCKLDRMLTTVTFSEEGPDETRVTVRWEIDENATEVEHKTFHDAKAGMMSGWTEVFDKLETELSIF